ncbi:MAG: hypothetical protein DRI69_09920 [Bacteroidetes bacterium]|nr:MAG: hypothetical protein DRI69_09920 [Bacteroidota bacterium]
MGEVVYQYDDLDKTHNSKSGLNLSCICCEESFSYLIFPEGDTEHYRTRAVVFDKRYPSFTKPLAYLSEVLADDHLLFDEFHKKTLAVRGVPFVSVPQDQLIHGNAKSLLVSQAEVGPNDTIHSDVVKGTEYALLFAIPELLNAEIQMFYKDARIRHSLSSLLCHALSGPDAHGTLVHANISHRWLEIVIVEGKALKYINQMRWHDQNDVVYYIAALLENLNIDNNPGFEFSGSAYLPELHDHLVEYLSIDEKQIAGGDHARVLDLRMIGSCV